MPRRLRRLRRLVMMFAFATIALGQPAGDEGLALVRQSDQALRALPAIAATIEREGVGAQATREPFASARVVLARRTDLPAEYQRAGLLGGDGAMQWRVAAFGTAAVGGKGRGMPFAYVSDGELARAMHMESADLVEAPGEFAHALLLDSGVQLALEWLIRWEELVASPLVDRDPRIRPTLDGATVINGEECEAIYVDLGDFGGIAEFGAWWYISLGDRLPRRLELVYYDVRTAEGTSVGDGITRITLRDIEILRSPGDIAPAVRNAAAILDDYPLNPDATRYVITVADDNPFRMLAPGGMELRQFEPPQAEQRRAMARPEPPSNLPAPEFTLVDADGTERTLSDYRGQVVVLDFWATWCGPCRQIMPQLQAVHEKYDGEGAVIFGVNAFENGDPKAFVEENGFTYPQLLEGDQVAAEYGVSALPTLFIIGPDGKIKLRKVGASGDLEEVLTEAIEAARGAN